MDEEERPTMVDIGQGMSKGVRKIELSKPTSSLGKRVWSAGFRTGNVDCWK